MAEFFNATHLRSYLRKQWHDRGYTIPDGDQVGVPIGAIAEHSQKRNSAIEMPHLDLWISILDEHISWFVSLSAVVWDKRHADREFSNVEKSLFLLISKIISDMSAIRLLVIAGYDTSARTILRSLSEYLEVLVAIIHKPIFADAFVLSDTPEGAQKFWEENLRGGGIRKRVEAAWKDFFNNDGKAAAEWFANWGRGDIPMLSGLAHPSLGGGLFSTIPLKVKYHKDDWPRFFGDKAESSVDTIFILLKFIFPVLLLGREFPFDKSSQEISRKYDDSDELHRHVKVGKDILASLILSLSQESNIAHVFPDIDMSIWPEDSKSV